MTSSLPEGILPYTGSLDRKKMSRETRIALESYYGQCGKCRNKNNRWFKHYGGKGLRVHYSSRDFVAWWIHHLALFNGKTASVGRIDHSRGYSFDNIAMICVSENSREALTRNKLDKITVIKTGVKLKILNGHGDHIATSSSIRDVARIFSVSQRLVQKLIRKEILISKKTGNFIFEYERQ